MYSLRHGAFQPVGVIVSPSTPTLVSGDSVRFRGGSGNNGRDSQSNGEMKTAGELRGVAVTASAQGQTSMREERGDSRIQSAETGDLKDGPEGKDQDAIAGQARW